MRTTNNNRVILTSVPKAGTYLGAEILQAMGFTATHLHIRHDANITGVYNFKNKPVTMSHAEELECFSSMPLENSLGMIGKGEFAVGHIPPLPEVKNMLCKNFKVVFLARNLRDCLISHMRYMIKTEALSVTDHPWIKIPNKQDLFKNYLINYAESVGPLVHMKLISCWEFDIYTPYPNMELFKLRFEDIISSEKEVRRTTLNALASFLEVRSPLPTDKLLNQVLGKQTMTRSDGLTVAQEYWSPYAEKWFTDRISTNGVNINKFIGYK